MIDFEWDKDKELINIEKHGVNFWAAVKAFEDPKRRIYEDWKHVAEEERYFCVAEIDGRILTVRFTYRDGNIRIIGAGYWRKGRKYYEKKKTE